MKTIKAYGKIENGKFKPRNKNIFYQELKEAGNVSDVFVQISGSNKRTPDQNAYAWAVFNAIAFAMRLEGWDVTADQLYHEAEEKYCSTFSVNEKTGETMKVIDKLKEKDTLEFFDIIETIRVAFNENEAIDGYIETPAEWFEITEEAYERMKKGEIDLAEARKISKELVPHS